LVQKKRELHVSAAVLFALTLAPGCTKEPSDVNAHWYTGPLSDRLIANPTNHTRRGCVLGTVELEEDEKSRTFEANLRRSPLAVLAPGYKYVGYRLDVMGSEICVQVFNSLFLPGEDGHWGLKPNRANALEWALDVFEWVGVKPLPPIVLDHWSPAEKLELGSWSSIAARARREIPEERYDAALVASHLKRLGRNVPPDLDGPPQP
jgi:hypothetical protein